MPNDRVDAYIAAYGFPASVEALEAFCGDFVVPLRTAIATLNEHGRWAGPVVLVAATMRGHEKRPYEVDYRVDVAASHPRLFVPRDRRLISMGLGDMVRWAHQEDPGAMQSGVQEHVLLYARLTHIRCWHGRAMWSARVLNAASGYAQPDARSLIAVLDRSELKPLATDPTRKHAPLRAPSLHPEQISLT